MRTTQLERPRSLEQSGVSPDAAGAAEVPEATAPWHRSAWVRAVIGLCVVGLVGAGIVAARRSPRPKAAAQPTVEEQVQTALDKAAKKAASQPAVSAVIYQAIAPSMVFISTGDGAVGADDPAKLNSLGSGVIINDEGAILTANHVVANATTIRLTFADGTEANGRIASQDPENDIAVLEADTKPEVIVPAVMGGGGRVGDEVYAVGHPLGLTNSMSAGVISGLNRSIPTKDGLTLSGLIQFDAAVNPGSSGGPLLNRNGQVIGIVSALANPSEQGYFVGIGFAVTIATAGGAAGGPPQ